MAQCAAGSRTFCGPDAMHLLFYKLCSLIQYPIIWVFVFDGLFRPPIKRGTKVIQKTPQWVGPCKQLLTAFGLIVHDVSSL